MTYSYNATGNAMTTQLHCYMVEMRRRVGLNVYLSADLSKHNT